jgi:hypothetical protein
MDATFSCYLMVLDLFILMNGTYYEAPHYSSFSFRLSLKHSLPQTMRCESVMPIPQGEPHMELAAKEFS